MKLFRHGAAGQERPGVVIEDKHYDLGDHFTQIDEDFLADDGLEKVAALVEKGGLPEISPERFGPAIHRPGKIVCIGLNYRKHAEESGMEVPKEPVVFFKASSSVTGPNDQIVIPRGSEKTDWEVELAVVIGKKASYVAKEDALDYVAGYVLHNDVSERAYQLERGGQWVKGKSCDTFAPLGPYLVTKDEIADPNNLNLWLKLNGEKIQDGNTNDFIFNVQHVISYLSEFMSLQPGDIISTGTPEGVGLGFKPPRYLKHGDVIELGIEGLGTAKQDVVAYEKING